MMHICNDMRMIRDVPDDAHIICMYIYKLIYICIYISASPYIHICVLDAYVMMRRAAPPHMARTRAMMMLMMMHIYVCLCVIDRDADDDDVLACDDVISVHACDHQHIHNRGRASSSSSLASYVCVHTS
jgi:hypothetical protein